MEKMCRKPEACVFTKSAVSGLASSVQFHLLFSGDLHQLFGFLSAGQKPTQQAQDSEVNTRNL